ncbi:ribonuclease J [Limnochorda pilosa]|uniref:Ribonuclease J n=1 Tax=Limnochorda pilosa TaxID=1555112 RepID=A0A0K2SMN7_LIMPI|nr:ribonuclease J [Limnochorda pilosa]BAS28393.1 ribonuclease J [Limnochorda pilosa]
MAQAPKVSVIPLGGLGEIGKNMTVIENQGEILVIDAGVMFPEDEMPGVDLVIPDISYLVERKDRVRAIVLTHGHEDHIGALPYVLRQLPVPVYGTRLTLGLVESKLEEHHLLGETRLREVQAGESRTIGRFEVEFIHVNHSIADDVALAIHTGAGTILYVTDFKFDQTPIDGRVTDLQKLAELGRKGVLLLMADSTNAERPGYTLSERVVGQTLMEVFAGAPGRILVATFASNIHRIQQVVDAADRYGRRLAVVGRSMVNVVGIASRLGYLSVPDGMQVPVEEIGRYKPQELVILSTGSQGEPMSALSRMAAQEHRNVAILPGDTVIISANPIPGNERVVGKVINRLLHLGAEVIHSPFSGIHASGHASQEELKLLLNLVRPRFFVPIHGEYRMLVAHKRLALAVGIPEGHVELAEIGDRLELTPDSLRKTERVPSGQVLVDGLGVGDVGHVVLRDRRLLSQDGILVVVVTVDKRTGQLVAGPEVVSRGFVYMRESEALMEDARLQVRRALERRVPDGLSDWQSIKSEVKEILSRYLFERTRRRPMVLPIVVEV